jgi:hypothetical protein
MELLVYYFLLLESDVTRVTNSLYTTGGTTGTSLYDFPSNTEWWIRIMEYRNEMKRNISSELMDELW